MQSCAAGVVLAPLVVLVEDVDSVVVLVDVVVVLVEDVDSVVVLVEDVVVDVDSVVVLVDVDSVDVVLVVLVVVRVVDVDSVDVVLVVVAQTLHSSHCTDGVVVKHHGLTSLSGFLQNAPCSSPRPGNSSGVTACSCGVCDDHAWHWRPFTVVPTMPR